MIPTLDYSKFYHLYNCGINHDDLFLNHKDYEFFLSQYEKYIYPVADTYAWVLMKNHFHFIVRIKDPDDIGFYLKLKSDNSNKQARFQTTESSISESDEHILKRPNPTLHFSHLFNSYSKYFNKRSARHGALFERPFQRIELTTDKYILQLIVYIHTNPVHHNFCENCEDYFWSSYKTILSSKKTKLKRDQVLEWFGDWENFIAVHKKKCDYLIDMKEWLLED